MKSPLFVIIFGLSALMMSCSPVNKNGDPSSLDSRQAINPQPGSGGSGSDTPVPGSSESDKPVPGSSGFNANGLAIVSKEQKERELKELREEFSQLQQKITQLNGQIKEAEEKLKTATATDKTNLEAGLTSKNSQLTTFQQDMHRITTEISILMSDLDRYETASGS